MREALGELLCCPRCAHSPLELTVIASAAGDPRDVETGYFRCPACARFYFIVEGIARLLTEDFAELVDTSLVQHHRDQFAAHEDEVEVFVSRLAARRPESFDAAWGIEDVEYWEDEYASTSRQEEMLAQATRSRPDAGNRMYPREVTIFRRLRPRLEGGGTLLDLGCGAAQAVRALCHPEEVGFHYIGCDLALSALRFNRRTLPGDFIQCSAEQPPFRPACVDALIMLGTLHHLSDPARALSHALEIVRPGGAVGVHEVTGRTGLGRFLGPLLSGVESPHDDSVDLPALRAQLHAARTRGVIRRGGSPARTLLAHRLGEQMRTSPALTRAVLGVDALCMNTLGRVAPFFGPREAVIYAERPL